MPPTPRAEEEHTGKEAGSGAAFMELAQRGVYGAEAGGPESLSDAVNRRKHFNQRGAAAAAAAFRR